MIAGFLSRFGKIGVILGFIAGNILLSYVSNGNTIPIIYLKEIIVASLGLLLVPKRIQINISDLFGQNLYLPVGAAYGLEASNTDTIHKLNTVSETINEMSRNYKEESKHCEVASEGKKEFIQSLEDKLDTIKENILYDDLVNEGNGFSSDIFDVLEEKGFITKDDILSVLEKRNEYILGFEDFDTNMKIEEDINQAATLINDIYKIERVNDIWQQRIKANKRVISSQLDGVSRAISNVAQLINRNKDGYEDEKQEIKILCSQKNIDVLDINIEQNKNRRYVVNVYISPCNDVEECRTYEIENILSKVLKDKIVLQKDNCALKEKQNLCKQIYVSKDKFNIQIGIAQTKKDGTSVSGDSNIQTKLDDGKYLIALSDGMGSGTEAKKSSQVAVKMLSRMLSQRV